MSSSFTTVQHKSWFGRMGNAMCGVCVGFLLFVLSFPVLFWNEHNAVGQRLALDEARQLVIEAGSELTENAGIEKTLNGKLVHVSGLVTVSSPVEFDDFGIRANAL